MIPHEIPNDADEAARAYFLAMARQMAPAIREMFELYASHKKTDFYKVYLVLRFRYSTNFHLEENQICELRTYGSSEKMSISEYLIATGAEETSEMKLLQKLLPMYADSMISVATKENVPVQNLFICLAYLKAKNNTKEDSVSVVMKCLKKPEFEKVLFGGEKI